MDVNMDKQHIIRLYDICGVESIQINGKWLDALAYRDLAKEAESLGVTGCTSGNLSKQEVYDQIIKLLKESIDEHEEINFLIPCDCLICEKGIPKSMPTNDVVITDTNSTQVWNERLKIIIYVLIKQQEKHARELGREIHNRNIQNSDIDKVIEKKTFVNMREIEYYLESHKNTFKFADYNWKYIFKSSSISKEFVSGYDKMNHQKGNWSLLSIDDPYSNLYSFKPSRSNNPSYSKSSHSNHSSHSGNSSTSPSSNKKGICGGLTKGGTPCQKIGFCNFHQTKKSKGSSSNGGVGNGNSGNSEDTDDSYDRGGKTNTTSNDDESKSESDCKKRKRSKRSSSSDSDNNDVDEEDNNQQLQIIAPVYISPTTFKVRELEKRILDNFNFYRFILKFESYGYRIAKEFSRFIALKVLCDSQGGGDNNIQYNNNNNNEDGDDIFNSGTILQPPKVIEEFWIQIILTSLEYAKLLKIINVEKIRYDPDLALEEIDVQKKRYYTTLDLYKKYFRISDKFDSEIWNDNFLN